MTVIAVLGWLDEGFQANLPNRIYDVRDVVFNVLACLMAIMARCPGSSNDGLGKGVKFSVFGYNQNIEIGKIWCAPYVTP